MAKESIKVAATNRRAHHDYFILEKFEAGIALSGTEVKSIRLGTKKRQKDEETPILTAKSGQK